MAETLPRIAVLTLASGEPQLEACRESVAEQVGVGAEQVTFSGYGNRSGHAALQRFVAEHGDEFEAFFKLDADMVLHAPSALATMYRHWSRHGSGALHAEFPVHDALGDIAIMGVHFYAAGARWSGSDEALFVDPRPDNVARRDKFPDFEPLVVHMPEPTLEQAFVYGFHRGLKAFQFDRWVPNLWQMAAQWRLLWAVRRAAVHEPTPARWAMLVGADVACSGRWMRAGNGNYRGVARRAFDELWAGTTEAQWCAAGQWAWRRLACRRALRVPPDILRAALAVGERLWSKMDRARRAP